MIQHIKAIYEAGVLGPLDPLDLEDDAIVTISVETVASDGEHADDYLPLVAENGDPNIT